jgi:hypothetical protein
MNARVLKRLFSVDEFHQMGEAGVFGEHDRLELLDGEVVRMAPIGSRHAACVMRVNAWCGRHAQSGAIVSVQVPSCWTTERSFIRTSPFSSAGLISTASRIPGRLMCSS